MTAFVSSQDLGEPTYTKVRPRRLATRIVSHAIANNSIYITTASTKMSKTMPSSTGQDAYKIDFVWKNFKGVITDNKTNVHIMDIDSRGMRKPQIKFSKGWEAIGTASLNTVSIHAECEIRGRAKKIQAMKRWTTEYTYLSDAFADGGQPVAMYWTSSSGELKTTFRERDPTFLV
jgi:hypothetical protein